LPGGLNVAEELLILTKNYSEMVFTDAEHWFETVKNSKIDFTKVTRWISCFALANEENASFGK
jgi:L-serine dehydratase